ncbi:MAG TPA: ThuA domain-containing protein [Solirubrobacteraceae bacterium]|nr:ThuA domain-containing protein [Solirubrobacteraceae bacterium]
MRRRTFVLLAVVGTLLAGLFTASVAPAQEAGPLEKVLVFSKTAGFRHDSIPQGIAAIEALGAANGFDVDATEDGAQFTDANLAQYDAVVFLSTTGNVLTDAQEDAFERYIQAGNGYVGIHAAADTEYEWSWYGDMLGGYFKSHPPGTPTATVNIEDTDEPSTTGLPASWSRTDEWYNYQSPANPPRVNGGGADYSPRTSDVHVLATVDEGTYDEQDDSAAADDHPISWCSTFDGGHVWYTGMGHTQGSFSEADFRRHILGGLQTVTGAVASDCGPAREKDEPSGSDFEIVTIDDDTESPMELDIASDGRVFYVERITGQINVYNPATGGVTTAGTIPVSSVQENGLMGIQLAPDFDTSAHLYVTYTPITPTNETRVSRFTVGANNTIALSSEQIIFTWQAQREQCCHSSGSLAFGLDGSLFISVGDNTNPFASDGYTPIDERPGREFWDAQRTAANTNNLNGKLLHIVPIPNATGAPGVGTTYTIPAGNMFPVGTANTRPEIYAMGFRNPFRITVDPKTGVVLLGDYGPDAGTTNPNRGPQGSVEFNVVDEPGFYGWPYCVRDNVPYNDYDFATGQSGPKFNCAAPVNNSPNNTGLTTLPPAQPAPAWIGYTETDPRHPALGTGGAPTGGPRYSFDPNLDSETKFPAFYDGLWFNGEWNNGWLKTFSLAGDEISEVSFAPWMDTFKRPMDIEFGPDGSLYMIDWGTGFGGNNLDSGIYRIDYVVGARRPVATATATPDSGPTPLDVQFSSTGSHDPDGTAVTYSWNFGDGTTSTEANPQHRYSTAGTYNVVLTVTDEAGQTGTDTVQVVAGNTRPTVELVIPEDGQFADFGETVPYEVRVTDPEDGTIDCNRVTLNIQLGHDDHAHGLGQQTGCSGTFQTETDGGHGANANIFTSLVVTYTDGGSGGAGALTGRDEAVLQPKTKQAEFYERSGRVAGSTSTGDPGVQKETTSDTGGGQNIGFIESGDYVSYAPTNLKDVRELRFRVASGGDGGNIEVRLDSPTGELVGTSPTITNTGGWQNWTTIAMPIAQPPAGTHELFFVFTHPTSTGGLFNLNWFRAVGKGAAVSEPPEVSATASPNAGTAPLAVTFDGTATDADSQNLTYRWDFGVSGTTDDTSTEQDPTYTYQRAGTYTARFTATDPQGASSTATVQVTVTSAGQCPQDGLRSDEFEGSALNEDRWTVLRPDAENPFNVSNGQLNLPIANGSMYGAGTTAENLIVQELPAGAWEVTAKVAVDELNQNYQQAGLRVWSNDDNWASVHMISAGGNRDFEFIFEDNGNPRNEGADKLGGIPATSPLEYYVRLVSDGTTLRAFYSFDGDTFLPVGRTAPMSAFSEAPAQIGPAALSDQAPNRPMSHFDWIRFNPDEPTGGGGGGGGGTTVTDNFDGTSLGSAWEVVRQDQNLTVGGGTLNIPAQAGDLYGGRNDAKNIVLRGAPTGPWQATAKMRFNGSAQYHQAGMIVYGDDSNFTKFGRIAHTAEGAEKFEFIYENAGTPRNEAADSEQTNLPADFPDDFYVRIVSDGTNITGSYSRDGSAWTPVGRPAPLPANARLGMFAFSNDGTGDPVAAFDSFTLTTGDGGTPTGPSRDDQFDGSSLDKSRWNAIVREDTTGYSVSGGNLTITTQPGDIYSSPNSDPKNFILQSADHAGTDWVIETKIDSRVNGGYGQGGLLAYGDDDNYVKLDPISDAGNTRINRIELRTEVNGTPTGPASDPQVAEGSGTEFWLRLTKTGSSYKGEYSRDGQTWQDAGTVTNAMASPDFGVFAFGPQAEGQGDTVAFDYFTLDGQDSGGPCECVEGAGDEFDGTSLDTAKFNHIVRDDATAYNVSGGALNVTTKNGDIYTAGNSPTAGPFFLQTADHAGADWVIETKVDASTLSGGYEQAGLLAYKDDDNYVKWDVISDDGQTAINRLELRSEVATAIQDPQPQLTPLPANNGTVWLRLTKAGTNYTGEYSFDGEAWTTVGTVPNAMTTPSFGLFTLGVNSGGGTARFDYFEVDGARGCEEPEPENRRPVIDSAAASPTVGYGPLAVNFTAAASDPDAGDEVTYSWDFGDGSPASTEQNPSHTYEEPGEYDAVLTVSDGELTATRTIRVQVLDDADPEARFRVLVFSKTTGFRHDSIDEGHAAIEALGNEHGFQVDHTEDATAFRDTVLTNYDTVVFLSTTGDPLNTTQQRAFERYIQAGGGYTGIHAAADTEYDWNWYGHLVGGYFLSHPPGTPSASIDVEDRTDHATAHLPARWDRVDEWYNYRSPDYQDPEVPDGDYSPRNGGVHVLLTMDEATYEEGDGNDPVADDHPISWCQRYDGGRSWYTGLGHTAASFSEENYLLHILGGIEISAGATGSDECGVPEPGNAAPTVTAAGDPRTGTAPLTVAFSANGSDADGDPLAYSWDFGDGTTSLRQNPDHTFLEPGTYMATVTVRDPQGATGTAAVEIIVKDPPANQPPTVEAAGDPVAGKPPLTVQFSAAGSDPDGDPLSYAWDFGDGARSFLQNPSHTYAAAGTYTATVTVTDSRGATATDTVVVTAGNRAPTVDLQATPTSGTAPLNVTFTATASDPDGDALSYRFDFGEGKPTKPGTSRTATHRYTRAGIYTATVTVTDADGATATDTVQVTVTRR